MKIITSKIEIGRYENYGNENSIEEKKERKQYLI